MKFSATLTMAGLSALLLFNTPLALAQNEGVQVGGNSGFTKLVPAEDIEQASRQQYAKMMQEAAAQKALAPAGHPQLQRLRGIAHLRGHVTDRLAALAVEITRLGGQAEQTSDGLIITPRPLHAGTVRTYHDHRMATAGALLGLRVPGVLVENIATTTKTLPDFPGMWRRMLAR